MPQVVIDNTKGLHQKTGSGFTASITDHGALANGPVNLSVSELINLFQSGGGSCDVTVSTTGASTGQIAIFANTHATNTSAVNGKTVAAGTAALLIYDGTAWIELA